MTWSRSSSCSPFSVTIVIVDRALRYSDRTYVMENGRIVHEGRSSDLTRETLAGAIAGVKAEAI